MTTPTPAQQQLVLRRMRDDCIGFAHLDEERAALDYALAALEAVEWRPIETAPRYTELLVYNERTKRAVVGFVYEFTEATHWMPLPAPPADAVEVSRG